MARSVGRRVRLSASRCVNVTFHGIGPIEHTLEPDEDQTWVDIEQFERVLDAVAQRDDVRITFDDGNSSDVEIALPRLLERGLKGHFFVLAGRLGEPGKLPRDGVRELVGAGMSVGSHGWAHRDWRRIGESEAAEELVEAHRVLRELTGQPVTSVAIPFGSYDRHVLRRLRQAKVIRAYTSDGGPAHRESWLQPRNSVRRDLDDAWFAHVLNGRVQLKTRVRRFAARQVKGVRGRP